MGEVENGGMKAKNVAICTESHNLTYCHLGEVGMVAKCFAAGQVGKMHFDGRDIYRGDGVSERRTGVGVCASVDDQHIDPSHRRLDGLDKVPFMIGLKDLEVDVVLGRVLLEPAVDFLKGDIPIHLRFPAAQQIQVWAV